MVPPPVATPFQFESTKLTNNGGFTFDANQKSDASDFKFMLPEPDAPKKETEKPEKVEVAAPDAVAEEPAVATPTKQTFVV